MLEEHGERKDSLMKACRLKNSFGDFEILGQENSFPNKLKHADFLTNPSMATRRC